MQASAIPRMAGLAGLGGESSTDTYNAAAAAAAAAASAAGAMIEPLPRHNSTTITANNTIAAGSVPSPFGYGADTPSGQALPPVLSSMQPSFGILNPAFSPHRLHYTLLMPGNVEYFNLVCNVGSSSSSPSSREADATVTVDKHDASSPVHVLPSTPSQAIMVEVRAFRRPTTLYKVEVLQVTEGDWAGWQGGFEYPSSTAHAPTARYFPVGGAGFAPDDVDPADLHVVNTKFYATCEEEQTLEIGQTILVVAKADTGWWAGFVWSASAATSAGWFPEGCVSSLDGPAYQRRSHYGGTPSPSPFSSPAATPMSAAMGSLGGPFSRLGSEREQQHFLQSSMRSIRSGRSLHDLEDDNDGGSSMVGEYLGALDQMSPGELADLENKLGNTLHYERPLPGRLNLAGGSGDNDSSGGGSSSCDSDESGDDDGANASAPHGKKNKNKNQKKMKKKKRRRKQKTKGGSNKVHPGIGPPDSPAAPARHRSPHLPLCSGLFGVVWIIMWMVQVGKFGTARPADNIFLGAGWEGQRAMGAVWPNDVTNRNHYHRLLTALFNPIGFFRLVMDLAALRIFGFRIEKMHGQ